MNRTRWKQRVAGSAFLQHAWAAALEARARWAWRLGRPYSAARHLLRARKHVPASRFGNRRAAFADRMLRSACFDGEGLVEVQDNAFRGELLEGNLGRSIRERYAAFDLPHRVRLRFPRPPEDPERQGDLMITKRPVPETGERGVIHVMFHETILYLPAVFDLTSLGRRYAFTLETSNWGAEDARFLPWIGRDLDVVVFAPRRDDYEYFQGLGTNLDPIRMGSGTYVDPERFQPRPDAPLEYDVVMVSAWDPLKRHEVLFQALARLRAGGRRLRTALIGYPMSWPQERTRALAARYGVEADCDFYELIPHEEVARIVAASGVSLLLSLEEGSNRSVYESMFCGTPVIVHRRHRGIDLEHVGGGTGCLAGDEDLADVLVDVLDHRERYDPRGWALGHIGIENLTRQLNERFREKEERSGRPWTKDMCAKVNAPSQRYADPERYREFATAYDDLARDLLPC